MNIYFSTGFYRAAALCSFASALTTLALIFLPELYSPVPDFEARMALVQNPWYQLRAWIYLLHPFLVLTAALAVALRCRFHAAGLAAVGLLGFLLWAGTEAGQQALTLVFFDRGIRAAWPEADAAARELLQARVAIYDALWDALYFLLLIGFFIGNVALALAAAAKSGSWRWLGAAYAAGAALTLLGLVPEFGGPVLWPELSAWLYPAIQPAARAYIGLWLWREAPPEPRS